MHGYAKDKEALVKRLHRIEGQVRGIERMVEEDRYCIDILTQIAAVKTALEQVGAKLLEDHVTHCVRRGARIRGRGRRGREERRSCSRPCSASRARVRSRARARRGSAGRSRRRP